ncbi:TenA family protein [Saccharomonospora sp. NPDC006951]
MTAERLSERLLAANAQRWERAQRMRFVREVAGDTIGDAAFARYLVFERRFVDTAARMCGAAVRTAPDGPSLSGHATALHNLVTDQYDYFTAVLADFGTTPEIGEAATAKAGVLTDVALGIADEHGYRGIVIALFAAEAMYRQWCTAAAARPSGRAAIAEWVDLHTREPFLSQVEFLRGEVDRLPVGQGDESVLAAVFGRMVDAEITFHDAAFIH